MKRVSTFAGVQILPPSDPLPNDVPGPESPLVAEFTSVLVRILKRVQAEQIEAGRDSGWTSHENSIADAASTKSLVRWNQPGNQ